MLNQYGLKIEMHFDEIEVPCSVFYNDPQEESKSLESCITLRKMIINIPSILVKESKKERLH